MYVDQGTGGRRTTGAVGAASVVIAVLGSMGLAGCAGQNAPPGFLPDPIEAQRTAAGGWMSVVLRDDAGQRPIEGEMIAVSADSAWVLADARVVAFATESVVSGELAGYDPKASTVGGLTALGMVSTASNGVFLVFTAPMWAIGGSLAARNQSRKGLEELPAMSWPQLAPFARFPQGLPPSLDRATLRPIR